MAALIRQCVIPGGDIGLHTDDEVCPCNPKVINVTATFGSVEVVMGQVIAHTPYDKNLGPRPYRTTMPEVKA